MAFGLRIGTFDFTYGSLSVVAKGSISAGSTVRITRANHPDITDWRVIFTPTGTRNVGEEEKRPSYEVSALAVTLTSPSDASAHNYLVLGR